MIVNIPLVSDVRKTTQINNSINYFKDHIAKDLNSEIDSASINILYSGLVNLLKTLQETAAKYGAKVNISVPLDESLIQSHSTKINVIPTQSMNLGNINASFHSIEIGADKFEAEVNLALNDVSSKLVGVANDANSGSSDNPESLNSILSSMRDETLEIIAQAENPAEIISEAQEEASEAQEEAEQQAQEDAVAENTSSVGPEEAAEAMDAVNETWNAAEEAAQDARDAANQAAQEAQEAANQAAEAEAQALNEWFAAEAVAKAADDQAQEQESQLQAISDTKAAVDDGSMPVGTTTTVMVGDNTEVIITKTADDQYDVEIKQGGETATRGNFDGADTSDLLGIAEGKQGELAESARENADNERAYADEAKEAYATAQTEAREAQEAANQAADAASDLSNDTNSTTITITDGDGNPVDVTFNYDDDDDSEDE